ncbi:MAG: hypothetical protein ACLR5Q_05235 [Coprococcus sp.]
MLLISGTPENLEKRRTVAILRRRSIRACTGEFRLGAGIVSNPPGKISYGIVVRCYRMAQKIYKFN